MKHIAMVLCLWFAACATVPPEPEPIGPQVCTHGGECESVRQRCRELASDLEWVDFDQCVEESSQ